jgi:hypothetical protein
MKRIISPKEPEGLPRNQNIVNVEVLSHAL